MLGRIAQPYGNDLDELIQRVKAEVDCQKLFPDDGTAESFGRYERRRCIHPDHPDQVPTLLVYPDGYTCPACSWRGDAIDLWRMQHPDVGLRDACIALLDNPDWEFSGEVQARVIREPDQDLAVRYHLALASRPEAVRDLLAMGFSPQAVRHYKLGLARVLVRLDPEEGGFSEELPELTWLTIGDRQVPYQRQERFAVPVVNDGRLRQVIYRKWHPTDLGAKVTLEKDAGAHLFGRDELTEASTAIIVEGWGEKLVVWDWGFTAVTSTNGAGHWSREWNAELANVKRLYVVGDADAAGQKMVRRVQSDLPWARPITLPWAEGSKMDLRDGKLAGWTRQDFVKLLRAADFKSCWRAFS